MACRQAADPATFNLQAAARAACQQHAALPRVAPVCAAALRRAWRCALVPARPQRALVVLLVRAAPAAVAFPVQNVGTEDRHGTPPPPGRLRRAGYDSHWRRRVRFVSLWRHSLRRHSDHRRHRLLPSSTAQVALPVRLGGPLPAGALRHAVDWRSGGVELGAGAPGAPPRLLCPPAALGRRALRRSAAAGGDTLRPNSDPGPSLPVLGAP